MSASAIYHGTLRHRRFIDGERDFSQDLTLTYLDLDEVESLSSRSGPLASRRPGALRFRRADYHGPAEVPLADAVRATVTAQLGDTPPGPIRLLSQLRSWGVSFNPISVYYCFEADGRQLHSVLAEVTNTPWGERHAYALGPAGHAQVLKAKVSKRMHVSPFLGMDAGYEIALTAPGDTLSLHISCVGEDAARRFDATLGLRRVVLSQRSLRTLARRQPFGALGNLTRIYAHGLALWRAGTTHYPHPVPGRSPRPAANL